MSPAHRAYRQTTDVMSAVRSNAAPYTVVATRAALPAPLYSASSRVGNGLNETTLWVLGISRVLLSRKPGVATAVDRVAVQAQ